MKKNIVFALAMLFSQSYTLSIPGKTPAVMGGGVAALLTGFYALQDYIRINRAKKKADADYINQNQHNYYSWEIEYTRQQEEERKRSQH